eukprot:COSAG06_NODE_58032_length_278_cov_0.821229_1_plen_22_part_01
MHIRGQVGPGNVHIRCGVLVAH